MDRPLPPEAQEFCAAALAPFGPSAFDPYCFPDGVRTDREARLAAERLRARGGRAGWIAAAEIEERLAQGR